jgi:hypothetical protein
VFVPFNDVLAAASKAFNTTSLMDSFDGL